MEKDFEEFLCMLLTATEKLEDHYFNFQTVGTENSIYRERVYCYELYHRIRECMPDSYQYVLNGEVDKRSHPIIEGNEKPDFIVHVPSEMNKNLAIIEVKKITAPTEEIVKDIEKLRKYCGPDKYFRGICLIYGESENWGEESKLEKIKRKISREGDGSILLITHSEPKVRGIVEYLGR